MTAIKSVASILVPYDTDQMFPVFGFGGKFRHNGEVSHCFPLNFNPQNPEVFGLQVSNRVTIMLLSCYYIYRVSSVRIGMHWVWLTYMVRLISRLFLTKLRAMHHQE